MSHDDNFEFDLLAELGFDAEDPSVLAALEDAEEHARVIETLVAHRKAQGLKQNQVAERMGTTQSRVSSFERVSGDPRLSTLMRYARAVDARVRVSVVPHRESQWKSISLDTTISRRGKVVESNNVLGVEAAAWHKVVA